ncbi:hypothetical protein SDC9_125976 [bioreactor metagenome]|uniref:Uncharacterized protein n=1 Tax=bioreactor metagenome TaxID=1076179 RepID=A0A645CPX5_9ZZZZ
MCEFGLQGAAVDGFVGIGSRLNRKLVHPLQDGMGLGESAFCGLHKGDRILAVFGSHFDTADLGAHFFRNRKAGRVVAGTVDAKTRRKLFHRLVG